MPLAKSIWLPVLKPGDHHIFPLARRITPSRPFLESPCRNFFQPTLNKEEIDTVGGTGSESRSLQRFLRRVSEFSILKKLRGNSQLHAGMNSKLGPVECRSLFDFNLALSVSPVFHHHPGEGRPDDNAQRCCVDHQSADLFEAGGSDGATPGPGIFFR